ncbi:MAG: hypothetical protein V8Q07_07440 [Acutalibacteraceae bacterium]
MLKDKNNSEKPRLTDEQLKKNSEKLEQYDRILKVTAAALAIMFGIIVCIVAVLIANNS